MGPVDILTPVIGLLAFLGYVWLLSFRFWIAIILTLTLSYVLWAATPYSPDQLIYWIAGTVLFATSLFAMSLLPAPHTQIVEVRTKGKSKIKPERDIIIDGTDVLGWGEHTSLDTLRAVVDHLRDKAMLPYVFLDPATQHIARDALIDESGYAKALGLKKERVMICPDKTEVDGFILGFAKDQNLAIISNDTFEDRSEIAQSLRLVRGMFADGHPVLDGV